MAEIKVPFYGHVRQYQSIKDEIDSKMQEVIISGQYVQGPMLKKFEAELAGYAGSKYAIGVGNGTDALWLAFMALGLGPGDELITNANTFFATAEAVWTNHQYINDRIRKLRNHGSNQRDHHSCGFNSRLDDLHAGILSAKLRHITRWSDMRIAIAKRYDEGLEGVKGIMLPYKRPGYRHVYHLYEIETVDAADRDRLLKYLADYGIDAKTHYSIAIHRQEGFPWGKDARLAGPLTNAEKNASSCISLPMFPELTDAEVQYVIDVLKAWKK